jgi:hypothetical protein
MQMSFLHSHPQFWKVGGLWCQEHAPATDGDVRVSVARARTAGGPGQRLAARGVETR